MNWDSTMLDEAVAIQFAAGRGLGNIVVKSKSDLGDGRVELLVTGRVTPKFDELSRDDADAAKGFFSEDLTMRLVVEQNAVVFHEWQNIQLS